MGMGRKGQVELFAIIGIIVVAVVAVYFSYQSGLFGTISLASLSESQKLVKDSVDSFIISGTLESISAMSEIGGIENPADFVIFLNKKVPYWSKNGVNIPDFSAAIRDKLIEYLKENKEAFAESFSKEVSLGEPSAFVTMFPDRIDVTVNMPTMVDGEALPQPYKVTVKTNIGKAFEYGKGFVNANIKNRFLEIFTIANMIISPLEDGINSVPISISLFECGDYVFRTWDDIKPKMEFLIKSTLANTYMFRGSPKGDYESSPAAQYEIPPFDFNNYDGINLSFHLPDNFELDRSNFQFTPEPIMVMAKPIPLVGACVSDPLLVKYFVKYPVIVRIRDSITGNILQFAIEVSIKDNQPSTVSTGYQTEPSDCDYRLCSAKIIVKDSSGKPIQYASASFFGCEIGKSDENGVIEGPAVCGTADLSIYRSGYAINTVPFSSTGPDNVTTVELRKMLRVPVHLHMVNVQKAFGSYTIEGHEFGLADMDSKAAQLELVPTEDRACDNGYCTRIFKKADGVMSNIPEGEYIISAGLLSKDFQTVYGSMVYPYVINNTKTLHIYLPYMINFLSPSDDNVTIANKALEMTRLLLKCNITPITDIPIDINNFGGCSVPYEQVE